MKSKGAVRLRFPALLLAFTAIALAPVAAQSTQSPTTLYSQGRQAQQAGDNFKAIELYKSALQMNRSYVQPMIGLAETYFALGDFQESLNFAQAAQQYDQSNMSILDLEGRAHIGLGDFAGAKKLFDQVLAIEPNNMEAQFGLAEIKVATGEPLAAAADFESALSISPENRRALLSLILLYDSLGNTAKANQYTLLALQAHPNDALTHFIAAKHYLSTGDLPDAQAQVETALQLDPKSVDETLLLSEIYERTGQYAKVVPLIQSMLKSNASDYLLWYSLGLAYDKLGRVTDSINSFARAFTLRPDDEISRIALESVLISQVALKDPLRAKYADYHFALGEALQKRYFIDQAIREYRRGLKIDPYSMRGRLDYANASELLGFGAEYLAQLEFLNQIGKSDTSISDSISAEKSALADSVSNTWGVDQFTLQREPYTISIFYTDQGSMIHYLAEGYLASYLRDEFQSTENISISGQPTAVDSFSQAFQDAYNAGTDYFVIFNFDESQRYFKVSGEIYASSTGTKVGSEQFYRTGNDRVTNALDSVVTSIDSLLPLRGKLINRNFDTGLIDLGYEDGLKKGDKLLIVKNGDLTLAKDRFGFDYPQSAVIGDFAVTKTDALVSEGTVTKNGFFDLINPEDWVIFPPPKGAPAPAARQPPPPGELYQSFLSIP